MLRIPSKSKTWHRRVADSTGGVGPPSTVRRRPPAFPPPHHLLLSSTLHFLLLLFCCFGVFQCGESLADPSAAPPPPPPTTDELLSHFLVHPNSSISFRRSAFRGDQPFGGNPNRAEEFRIDADSAPIRFHCSAHLHNPLLPANLSLPTFWTSANTLEVVSEVGDLLVEPVAAGIRRFRCAVRLEAERWRLRTALHSAALIIRPPLQPIVRLWPLRIDVAHSKSIRLECTHNATAAEVAEIFWIQNGRPLNQSIGFRIFAAYPQSILRVAVAETHHVGLYSCHVRLRSGLQLNSTRVAEVQVLSKDSRDVATPIETILPPDEFHLRVDEEALFECVEPNMVSAKWAVWRDEETRELLANDSILILRGLRVNMTGVYECDLTLSDGTVRTHRTELNVIDNFFHHETAQLSVTQKNIGTPVKLMCRTYAQVNEDPSMAHWFKDGRPLGAEPSDRIYRRLAALNERENPDQGQAVYVSMAQREDQGLYECVVRKGGLIERLHRELLVVDQPSDLRLENLRMHVDHEHGCFSAHFDVPVGIDPRVAQISTYFIVYYKADGSRPLNTIPVNGAQCARPPEGYNSAEVVERAKRSAELDSENSSVSERPRPQIAAQCVLRCISPPYSFDAHTQYTFRVSAVLAMTGSVITPLSAAENVTSWDGVAAEALPLDWAFVAADELLTVRWRPPSQLPGQLVNYHLEAVKVIPGRFSLRQMPRFELPIPATNLEYAFNLTAPFRLKMRVVAATRAGLPSAAQMDAQRRRFPYTMIDSSALGSDAEQTADIAAPHFHLKPSSDGIAVELDGEDSNEPKPGRLWIRYQPVQSAHSADDSAESRFHNAVAEDLHVDAAAPISLGDEEGLRRGLTYQICVAAERPTTASRLKRRDSAVISAETPKPAADFGFRRWRRHVKSAISDETKNQTEGKSLESVDAKADDPKEAISDAKPPESESDANTTAEVEAVTAAAVAADPSAVEPSAAAPSLDIRSFAHESEELAESSSTATTTDSPQPSDPIPPQIGFWRCEQSALRDDKNSNSAVTAAAAADGRLPDAVDCEKSACRCVQSRDDHNTMEVRWRRAKGKSRGDVVPSTYSVHFALNDTDEEDGLADTTPRLFADGDEMVAELRSLFPALAYRITIEALNDAGMGVNGTEFICSAAKDLRLPPPQPGQVSVLGGKIAQIQWTPPLPLSMLNRAPEFDGYTLHWRAGGGSEQSEFVKGRDSRTAMLATLQPGVDYVSYLTSHSSLNGDSPLRSEVFVIRLPDPPPPSLYNDPATTDSPLNTPPPPPMLPINRDHWLMLILCILVAVIVVSIVGAVGTWLFAQWCYREGSKECLLMKVLRHRRRRVASDGEESPLSRVQSELSVNSIGSGSRLPVVPEDREIPQLPPERALRYFTDTKGGPYCQRPRGERRLRKLRTDPTFQRQLSEQNNDPTGTGKPWSEIWAEIRDNQINGPPVMIPVAPSSSLCSSSTPPHGGASPRGTPPNGTAAKKRTQRSSRHKHSTASADQLPERRRRSNGSNGSAPVGTMPRKPSAIHVEVHSPPRGPKSTNPNQPAQPSPNEMAAPSFIQKSSSLVNFSDGERRVESNSTELSNSDGNMTSTAQSPSGESNHFRKRPSVHSLGSDGQGGRSRRPLPSAPSTSGASSETEAARYDPKAVIEQNGEVSFRKPSAEWTEPTDLSRIPTLGDPLERRRLHTAVTTNDAKKPAAGTAPTAAAAASMPNLADSGILCDEAAHHAEAAPLHAIMSMKMLRSADEWAAPPAPTANGVTESNHLAPKLNGSVVGHPFDDNDEQQRLLSPDVAHRLFGQTNGRKAAAESCAAARRKVRNVRVADVEMRELGELLTADLRDGI